MRERFPIQTPDLFLEPLADRVFAIKTEDFAGGVVQVSHAALGIGDDDSFLDGIENGLEKSFFLRETKEIILHLLRPDPAETADQFFQETWFHRRVS